jgi:tetratricopeptide (TPR) repeat protein
MGKVLQFSAKTPAKFGFERVKKRKKTDRDLLGQLNLFSGKGQILRLPRDISPFEEALLLDERGDRRAAESYGRAISEGDCVADAYCNLGILESNEGRTGKAFDCFTKSLRNDPRHFESHYNLGNLYFDSGDLRLARTHYEMAAEVEPTFPNLYFNLGLAHALNEEFRDAINALNRYKELAPKSEGRKADELLASLERGLSLKG